MENAIICNAHDYRTTYPFTMEKESRDKSLYKFRSEFPNVTSPIPGGAIVDISKIDIVKHGKTFYGIKFVIVDIQKIMVKYNKKIDESFYIKLLNKEGDPADKCIVTEEKLPFIFYYNGAKQILSSYEIVDKLSKP